MTSVFALDHVYSWQEIFEISSDKTKRHQLRIQNENFQAGISFPLRNCSLALGWAKNYFLAKNLVSFVVKNDAGTMITVYRQVPSHKRDLMKVSTIKKTEKEEPDFTISTMRKYRGIDY